MVKTIFVQREQKETFHLERRYLMIKREDELKVKIHEDFMGGKGTLKNIHFLDEENSSGKGRLFVKSILTPGSSIGNHRHSGDFETYYILNGEALVTEDDGSEHILEAGDVMHTPDGSSHSIENYGDENLEYIAIILYN